MKQNNEVAGVSKTKSYMTQYRKDNKAKIAAQQLERDRKKREAREADPALQAEYRAKRHQQYLKTHPGARTMKEHRHDQVAAKRARTRVKIDSMVNGVPMRTCSACGHSKALDEFHRHGTHGRDRKCITCASASTRAKSKQQAKELPRFVVSTERKHNPTESRLRTWDAKLISEGWVKLLSERDSVEWGCVYIRHGVILYIRGNAKSYSTAKQTYGVMFDDSGRRYPNLGQAESVAERIIGIKVKKQDVKMQDVDYRNNRDTWLNDNGVERAFDIVADLTAWR